jgi:RNA polymerase sigma factor (sigma-70 family)
MQAKPVVGSDAALYESLAPELIGFACGLVGPDDAPDVLASAVVSALASRSWPNVENRRAYLYRAVLNEAGRWRRRAAMRRDREALTARALSSEPPEFHPEVRAAVDSLSVQQRAVILLTYWADLDSRTVAETLGISDGAVRRHLARGRARLREVLND